MKNGEDYRQNHQPESEAHEIVIHPLVYFVACEGENTDNGHHFESKTGITDEIVEARFDIFIFLLHWLRQRHPFYMFRRKLSRVQPKVYQQQCLLQCAKSISCSSVPRHSLFL